MTVGVVIFPGSNCDHDCVYSVGTALGHPVREIWHKETSLGDVDAVLLPGGFSYGDYLRSGAIASLSPVMNEVRVFADKGGPVMGICNGFQMLTEAHLLPGALVRNKNLAFLCKDVYLRVERPGTCFTSNMTFGQVLKMPIAHMDGCYVADDETLKKLNDNGQVIFRFATATGDVNEAANHNGSAENITGVMNEKGNVLGLMPHPDRAFADNLGSSDGRLLLQSFLESAG